MKINFLNKQVQKNKIKNSYKNKIFMKNKIKLKIRIVNNHLLKNTRGLNVTFIQCYLRSQFH